MKYIFGERITNVPELGLFNLNGRLVLKKDFTGTEGTVISTFLPSGTYIYKITSEEGLFESGKWMKQ